MYSRQFRAVIFLLFAGLFAYSSSQSSCYNSYMRTQGRCILVTDCPSMKKILLDTSRSRQEAQLLRSSTCGPAARIPSVCCTDPVQNNGGSGDNLLPRVCGKSASGENRIVGGTETALDDYPWLTLIQYRDKLRNVIKPLCGGSLISNRYVLTAAHCLTVDQRDYSTPLNVVLGEHDLRTERDCRVINTEGDQDCNDPPTIVPVESFVYHEQYQVGEKSGHNDIGLIRLSYPVDWSHTDFIRPICLPAANALRYLQAPAEVYAAGWGKTENSSRSDVKLDVKIKMATSQTCQNAYNRWRVQLFDGQICAGGEKGKDSCSGDSGGPLMTYNEQSLTWQIVGVVSFGPNYCGMLGIPGVYASVPYYLDWIKSHLQP